ncbi:MAG: hypothetical protein JXM69_17725 [Anaerolineae bacterium]|nr:hypothetical protein [Anaerolineae bacterium]
MNNRKSSISFLPILDSLLPILILLIAVFFRLYQLPILPPGLNFDEAGNGVAALDILRGDAKLWWRIGGGKEPLWPYLIALSTVILGNVPLALRLPAALAGIFGVAAVYPLLVGLFRGPGHRSCLQARLMALLTMLGLALSSWHLHFSRLGFRAILFPGLASLGFYFLWRVIREQGTGVRGQMSLDLVWAALFIALAVYAYLAARLLWLVPVLFFVLHWLIANVKQRPTGEVRTRGNLRSLFIQISNFLFVLLLILVPLVVYFVLHPADFVARSTTVSIFNPASNQGNLPGTAWRGLTLTLGTFVGLTGDANSLVNLPNQPAVSIFLAPFFVIGIIASLYRIIHADPSAPSPHLFLLCWWVVMLLPAILAPEGAPHHLRLLGTIVPTYALAALGLVATVNFLTRSVAGFLPNRQAVSRIAYLLLVTCYLLLATQTYLNYFIRWPTSVDFTLPFDLYAVRLANDIAHAPPTAGYVLPMDIRAGPEARHYTLDYLLAQRQPAAYTYLPVDEPNAETLLARAARGKAELRVVRWTADKHQAADAKEIVTYLLVTNAHLAGRQSFPVYDIETYAIDRSGTDFEPRLPPIDRPVGATFGGLLRIDAVNIPAAVSPGDVVPIALALAPLTQMDADYKASLRLIGPTGERVAQKDRVLRHNFHQGTSLWPPETVNEYYLLPVPPETPPGKYVVAVVIYHPDTQAPLLAGDLVEAPLGTVQVR